MLHRECSEHDSVRLLSQNKPKRREANSSSGRERHLSSLWSAPVPAAWSSSPWDAESPLESLWPPGHSRGQRPAQALRAAEAARPPAPRVSRTPWELPSRRGASPGARARHGGMLSSLSRGLTGPAPRTATSGAVGAPGGGRRCAVALRAQAGAPALELEGDGGDHPAGHRVACRGAEP